MRMDSKKLALLCRELAEEKKAEETVVLDVRKVSSITDYFVVATGTSEPHLRAIVNEIRDKLHEKLGLKPRAMDGGTATAWIVLDYFDVIIHIMRADIRQAYDLESLWGDAPEIQPKKKSAPKREPASRPKKTPSKPRARSKA